MIFSRFNYYDRHYFMYDINKPLIMSGKRFSLINGVEKMFPKVFDQEFKTNSLLLDYSIQFRCKKY